MKYSRTDNAIGFIYNMYHLLFSRQLYKNNMHLSLRASKVFLFFLREANMAACCEFSAHIISLI